MNNNDSRSLFEKQIEALENSNWKIEFNSDTLVAKIVDERGIEIDIATLGFLLGQLEEYGKLKIEQKYGERRKTPIDEFTKKRIGVLDYVLIEDEHTESFRKIFEAFHDQNELFNLESFYVSKKNGLIHEEFNAYLPVDEAEKLLEPLQNFVDKYKKDDSE
ncbi:hypothetical protein LOZ80_39050 [Paenibacillus sp. HWE-109]|uniref:hypothetical protein n=1 Tax=Paenibacillus sp. HWE-109 TaxID=1306526 RepID=UPI001EDD68E2|nr:hypothetical protein [Paenibacillus sp. HWE-109]UKS27365.1 hypothetical protein LOZ80_39050 [Paenibacillus sp. HWE-109]